MEKISLQTKMRDIIQVEKDDINLVVVDSINSPRIFNVYEANIFSVRNKFKKFYGKDYLEIMASLAKGEMILYDFLNLDEEILFAIFGDAIWDLYLHLEEFACQKRLFDAADTLISEFCDEEITTSNIDSFTNIHEKSFERFKQADNLNPQLPSNQKLILCRTINKDFKTIN